MSAIAFDTLKIAQQFQEAGFSRKQAAGAAEILADLLARKSDKDAVIEAIETLGISVDRRFFAVAQQLTEIRGDIAELRAGPTEMRGDITEIRGDIAGLKTGQERLFGLLARKGRPRSCGQASRTGAGELNDRSRRKANLDSNDRGRTR